MFRLYRCDIVPQGLMAVSSLNHGSQLSTLYATGHSLCTLVSISCVYEAYVSKIVYYTGPFVPAFHCLIDGSFFYIKMFSGCDHLYKEFNGGNDPIIFGWGPDQTPLISECLNSGE